MQTRIFSLLTAICATTSLFGCRLVCTCRTLKISPQSAAEGYKLGPDSMAREGGPRGEVTQYRWQSKIFPGTVRDYWIYVPAQYDAAKPACVMVFQDGNNYQKTNGDFRATIVFDNLIHKK